MIVSTSGSRLFAALFDGARGSYSFPAHRSRCKDLRPEESTCRAARGEDETDYASITAVDLGATLDAARTSSWKALPPVLNSTVPNVTTAGTAGFVQFQGEDHASHSALAVPAAPDIIVLGPTGTSAALYYRRASKVTVLTGLPAAPSAGRTMEIP